MTEDRPAPNGLRLGMIVGGLVVLAVVAAAIAQVLRPTPVLDPESPEGIVQEFLVAVEEEDYARAHGLLSKALRAECDQSDLAASNSAYSRVVVDDVTVLNDETLVTLRATAFQDDPFSPYSYETTLDFTLVTEGGIPRIRRLPFTYFCG